MLNGADTLWAAIAGIFLLAGLVKGIVGMGLPTVAMGLLALAMPPAEAAALLLAPSFVTNVWQLFAGPSLLDLSKRLWTMMIGIIIGTISGAGFLTSSHATTAQFALGVALMVYATLGLFAVRFAVSSKMETWLSPLVGLMTGLITGATGVSVVPAVPYLQALQLGREELIQGLGLSFTVSTCALGIGLLQQGVFTAAPSPLLFASLLALVPALLGLVAGQHLREWMSIAMFRRVFFGGLLLLGLYLVL
jgi:uncharacterized protein